ncbi:DMT family transporter [Sulfodiicoccus acidiphilus]|nr:DMT family transporter [Sulfodiicoccus acidiphilus]
MNRGYLYMLGVVVVWGLSYPLSKLSLTYMSPFVLAFFRFLVGGLALLLLSRGMQVGVKETINGVLNVFLLVLFLNLSLMFTHNPALASVLIYTQPLFVLTIALFLGESVGRIRMLGVLIGFAGALLSVGSTSFSLGSLFAVAGGFTWAVGTTYFRRNVSRGDLVKLNSFMALLSALLDVPLMSYDWKLELSPEGIALAVVVGLTAQAVGFLLWFSAVRELGPVNASATSILIPASAYVLSFLVLGTVPTLLEVIGSSVALLGVFISQFGERLARA